MRYLIRPILLFMLASRYVLTEYSAILNKSGKETLHMFRKLWTRNNEQTFSSDMMEPFLRRGQVGG
jgi:hypothetical protein